MNVVVDASVVVKWWFPEAASAAALDVLAEATAGSCDLHAPDLIVAEFANVLWRKARRGEWEAGGAGELLELWRIYRPRLVASELLEARALTLAMRLYHAAYDCFYLATAVELGGELVTADVALAEAARAVVPRVRLLA